MIELAGVRIDMQGRSLLDRIDCKIVPGEFVAVLGPNGIGKTTLLRTIAGMRQPSKGTIRIGGDDVACLNSLERARRVAFVTGDEVLVDALSVDDVVSIGRFPHHRWWEWRRRPADDAAIALALQAVDGQALAQRSFATLSSGERQRVWIALGLAQETPILLLDEPTTHLDVRIAHDILALLRSLADAGRTIVCALHDLNDAASYADRLALLGASTLLALDEPEAVFAGDLLERTYGIAMQRTRLEDGTVRVFVRREAR